MTTPDGRVYDHAAPSDPSSRCIRCGRLKAAHAGPLRRWMWRMGWL